MMPPAAVTLIGQVAIDENASIATLEDQGVWRILRVAGGGDPSGDALAVLRREGVTAGATVQIRAVREDRAGRPAGALLIEFEGIVA